MPEYSLYHITSNSEAKEILSTCIQSSEDGTGGPGTYLWIVRNTEQAHKAFLYQLYDFIYEYKLDAFSLQDDQEYIDNHLEELFTLLYVTLDESAVLYNYDEEPFSFEKDVDEAVLRDSIPCTAISPVNNWEKLLLPLDPESTKPFDLVHLFGEGTTSYFNQK